jgi:Na+-driven multidrug efflux pump
MLVRLDRPFVVSLICICALGLNVSLILLLVPTLGIVGASVASSVAYAAQAAAYARWLLRSTPLKLSDLRPGRSDLMLLLALMRRRQRTSPAAP